MNWPEIAGVCLGSIAAVAGLVKYIVDAKEKSQSQRDDALSEKMDVHFEYQREKFDQINDTINAFTARLEGQAAKIAEHDKRIAVVETRLDHHWRQRQ